MNIRTIKCAGGVVPFAYHRGVLLTPKLQTYMNYKEHGSIRTNLSGLPYVQKSDAGEILYALPGGRFIPASKCNGVEPKA